jgi:predicted dehydrogenase
LLEQAIHPIDIARLLVGDITHVFARAERLLFPNAGELDSEDTIVLAYQFASGALGTHTDSCAMYEFNWEVELFGPDWRLLVDFARKRLSGHIGNKTIRQDFPDIDLHLLEMQAFMEAVRYSKPDLVRSDFADATKTLAAVLAGDRSIQTGAWETVEEV